MSPFNFEVLIMKHVFKAGSGDWEKDGVKYDCVCTSSPSKYLEDGYSLTLEEALAKAPKKKAPQKAKANDKKN